MKKLSRFTFTIVMGLTALTSNAIAQGTGLLFMPEEEYRNIPAVPAIYNQIIPNSHDLSNKFPPVGDQGDQGSCVGWAVGYALKGYQEGIERGVSNWTPDTMMSPSYVYNNVKAEGCQSGAYIPQALSFLSSTGTVTLKEYGYSDQYCDANTALPLKQAASLNRIANWYRVNAYDTTTVKRQLVAGFPVIIGAKVGPKFHALSANSIWTSETEFTGGHAMVVTGYDDSKNAFKVMNSWGRNWGTQGYGWISYDHFKSVVREAYVTQDIIMPQNYVSSRSSEFVIDGPHGPSFFGMQLGMDLNQTKANAKGQLMNIDGSSRYLFRPFENEFYSNIIVKFGKKTGTLDQIKIGGFSVHGSFNFEKTINNYAFKYPDKYRAIYVDILGEKLANKYLDGKNISSRKNKNYDYFAGRVNSEVRAALIQDFLNDGPHTIQTLCSTFIANYAENDIRYCEALLKHFEINDVPWTTIEDYLDQMHIYIMNRLGKFECSMGGIAGRHSLRKPVNLYTGQGFSISLATHTGGVYYDVENEKLKSISPYDIGLVLDRLNKSNSPFQ